VIDGYYLKKMSHRILFELGIASGVHFDYGRFTDYIEQCIQTGLAEKYYLDSLPEPVPKDNLRFLTALKVLGFQCPRFSYKKKKVFCPSQDCYHHRTAFEIDVQAGVDVGIAVKILERGVFGNKEIDTIVLVSGDGDFVSAIETAQQHQKNLWLFSFPSSLSPELRSHFGAQYVDCSKPEIFERFCSTAAGDAIVENEPEIADMKNDDPQVWNAWSEHEAADGRRYWYNHMTYRSTWHKPVRPEPRSASPLPLLPQSPRFFPPQTVGPPESHESLFLFSLVLSQSSLTSWFSWQSAREYHASSHAHGNLIYVPVNTAHSISGGSDTAPEPKTHTRTSASPPSPDLVPVSTRHEPDHEHGHERDHEHGRHHRRSSRDYADTLSPPSGAVN